MVDIYNWTTEQVADWLKGLDDVCQQYIPQFIAAGVTGRRLLCLNHHDLATLSVTQLGHQELILEGVELLSRLHYELESETLQSISLKLSCQVSNLQNELATSTAIVPPDESIGRRLPGLRAATVLSSLAYVMATLKKLISWLDRPPFDNSSDYLSKRRALIQVGLGLLSAIQPENINTAATIMETCNQLESVCGSLVRESSDPLTIQPASLEVALVRKPADEELGISIESSCCGIHVIEGIKQGSAADLCGKLEEGDEVVKVNDQIVVGWQMKHMVAALKENPKEVILMLKKRPHHTNPLGNAAQRKRLANKLKQSLRRSKKGDRSSRAALTAEFLKEMPAPSETVHSAENDSESEPEIFQLPDGGIADYIQEGKQRRATVSGGSPTIKRPTIKITEFTGRPKSDTIILLSPSSEESFSTGSITPDGLTTPEADMKTPPSDDNRNVDLESTLKANTHSDTSHTSDSNEGAPKESPPKPPQELSQRYKEDALRAAQEIPGDVTDSPKLVRMCRIYSNKEVSDDEELDDLPDIPESDIPKESKSLRPLSTAGSYTVNIVAGVPQKVHMYQKSPTSSTQSPTSILRSSRKTVRKVGANRRISCKDLGHGDCQGWLWKKREGGGVLSSTWVKRWVVLKHHNLYFYKDQEDDKAQGVIYLPGFQVSPAPKQKKKYAFKTHHSGTTFYFAAERQDDMGKWMNKLALATLLIDTEDSALSLGGRGTDSPSNPGHHVHAAGYYSESDDEEDAESLFEGAASGVTSPSGSLHGAMSNLGSPNHSVGGPTPNTGSCSSSLEGSREDLQDKDQMASIYRKIVRADLGIDGASKKLSRASMLARHEDLHVRNNENLGISRKLSSLQRTLKAKEHELLLLDQVLGGDEGKSMRAALIELRLKHPSVIDLLKAEENPAHQSSSSSTSGESTEVESLDEEDC